MTRVARMLQQPPARQTDACQGREPAAHTPHASPKMATARQLHAKAESADKSGASQAPSGVLQEEAVARGDAGASESRSRGAAALADLRALAGSGRLHLHPTFAYQVSLLPCPSLPYPTHPPLPYPTFA